MCVYVNWVSTGIFLSVLEAYSCSIYFRIGLETCGVYVNCELGYVCVCELGFDRRLSKCSASILLQRILQKRPEDLWDMCVHELVSTLYRWSK